MEKIRKRLFIILLVTSFVFLLPAITVLLGVGAQTQSLVNTNLPHYTLTVIVYPTTVTNVERPLVKIGIITPNSPNEFGKPVGDQCIWYGFTQPDYVGSIYQNSVSVLLPQGEYVVWVAYSAQLVNLNATKTITFL